MYRLGLHFPILLSFNLKRVLVMFALLAFIGFSAYTGTAPQVADPPPEMPLATAAAPIPNYSIMAALFNHIKWIEHRFPATDKFWEKYLPIAQLGCAISIAYLALPYFRHLKTLGERAAPIVGRTPDEVNGFRRQYYGDEASGMGQTFAAGEKRHELVGLLTLSHPLIEVPKLTRGELEKAIKKLKGNECFIDDSSRQKFLDTYLTGGDIATVLGGLLLGLIIHILAFIENLIVWQTRVPLGNGPMQVFIFLLLLFWTCGAPIYFAYHGARVSLSLDGWLHAAHVQRQDFDNSIKRRTGQTIDGAFPND